MTLKKADKKRILKYVTDISGEWCCDYEYFDLVVEVDVAMLKDPMFKIEIIEEDDEYIKTNIGCFIKTSSKQYTWFWAIATRRITENSYNRKKIGTFILTDSESGSSKHFNTKIWREFKKAIEPYLDKVIQEEFEGE